ncbi:MAG: hypothetical protein BECKG1743E_GA0114224_102125 [Candidatus Kentron sp. G]|nr:MAG: hypothetical protein BECKG1743E_GA0114224_102125 [Candidatus Kentron sp. G]
MHKRVDSIPCHSSRHSKTVYTESKSAPFQWLFLRSQLISGRWKIFIANLTGLVRRAFLPLYGAKAISIKEYTNLLVFIVQLLHCNNSYIVHYAPIIVP